MTRATVTIPEAAKLLGVSRNTAYAQARTGQLAGVDVIRVGRRMLIPREPLREKLDPPSQLLMQSLDQGLPLTVEDPQIIEELARLLVVALERKETT